MTSIFLSKWVCERENEAWEYEVLHSLHSCCSFYVHPGKELEMVCFLNIPLHMAYSFKRKKVRVNMFLAS